MARLVLGLGLSFTAIVLVGMIALYLLAFASGVLEPVRSFVSGLGIELNFAGLLVGTTLVLIAASAGASMLAGVGAVLFNLLTDILGGVEVEARIERGAARSARGRAVP